MRGVCRARLAAASPQLESQLLEDVKEAVASDTTLKRKFEADGTYDIDYLDVCRAYPEYAVRAESDKSKRTWLSKVKSILRNGWEREALTVIAESTRIDESLTLKAKEYLNGLDDSGDG